MSKFVLQIFDVFICLSVVCIVPFNIVDEKAAFACPVASQAAVPDEEISNDDLLSLMRNYFDKKLSGIERNFADTTQDLARKVNNTENDLRYKGNQVQFDLNSDILDNVSGALGNLHHKRYSKAVSYLEESENVLKKRNKLIRIADKSEAGWKTVDEYLSDEVASNSEDEKKIRVAEARAMKKMKVTKGSNRSVKKRPAKAAGGPSSVAREADGVATVSQPPFRVGGASGSNPRFVRSKAGDTCYKCGFFWHCAKECKNGGNSNFTAPRGSSA
ncbi:Hypothetical predicted protein [Mytilus galloprovincialis]|uniref:CCHC-type domain-containing protein n=1 Tax=Mytilus galloprovincialis TaxID=29158 RepID=A0A8B6ENE0_MYTGA|nr:Hypothetical predicted protein [Mytilus galloprovincialis]